MARDRAGGERRAFRRTFNRWWLVACCGCFLLIGLSGIPASSHEDSYYAPDSDGLLLYDVGESKSSHLQLSGQNGAHQHRGAGDDGSRNRVRGIVVTAAYGAESDADGNQQKSRPGP